MWTGYWVFSTSEVAIPVHTATSMIPGIFPFSNRPISSYFVTVQYGSHLVTDKFGGLAIILPLSCHLVPFIWGLFGTVHLVPF